MPVSFIKQFKIYIILGFLFCAGNVCAQTNYQQYIYKIDSLADIGLPKLALKIADSLDAIAVKNNNAPIQIRAVVYRMTFQSYLQEDALVAIISSLRQKIVNTGFPVKPVLQSLLAQMYWNYYQQNRYQFSSRSRLMQADTDFRHWDLQTLTHKASELYEASLADATREQQTDVGLFNGVLAGDSTTRYLRPTLYDLLVHRALDFFLTDESALTKPRLPFNLNNSLYFKSGKVFAELTINTTDTASTWYKGIKYLQQATTFHLKYPESEAAADVDLRRLRFLFSNSAFAEKDSLYLAALHQLAETFPSKPVCAGAFVLLGQFYQQQRDLVVALNYYKTAFKLFPGSVDGKNAAVLIKQIEEKQLSATIEDVNLPDKPILALCQYKNVSSAKVAIYKVSEQQMSDYLNSIYSSGNSIAHEKHQSEWLRHITPVQSKAIKWSDPADYRNHSFEFKISPLKCGNYFLTITDTVSGDTSLIPISHFKVSRLAYVIRKNPDGGIQLIAADRASGTPQKGVRVECKERYYHNDRGNNWNEKIYSGLTDVNGAVLFDQMQSDNISISLASRLDTLSGPTQYIFGAQQNDNNDDEPEDKTILFTDRQIYRPGQIIYFKGLQLQTLKEKSHIMLGKKVTVSFEDVNGKQVAALNLLTNAFGTFAGSFIIPQTMLDGEVELTTDDGKIDIRVEEYKRPTFQVEFLPFKESYKLNDSVAIKGTVRAYSGYGLSQAKVAYHIVRTFGSNISNISFGYNANRVQNFDVRITELAADTIATDDLGNFTLKFKAIPGEISKYQNYNYTINADVTDAGGETHSAVTNVTIGEHDIRINSFLPQILFSKDSVSANVGIVSLNNQPQKGKISVEIFALKNTGRVYKNRLWQKPDNFSFDKAELIKDFPYYAFNNEDVLDAQQNTERIANLKLNMDGVKSEPISLAALRLQHAGIYRVLIRAQNEQGDTAAIIRYINLVQNEAKPLLFTNWLLPKVNTVMPGSSADFLVCMNAKVNVLVERYSAAKLISSKWMVIDRGQQHITFPITDTDKNVAVQFMMIYQNRLLSSYQPIYVREPDKELKIKWLTLHDRLQPGQKEQWKMRITNQQNEQQQAELLAAMYDASLDDIAAPANWQNPQYSGNSYRRLFYAWQSYNFVNEAITSSFYPQFLNYTLQTRDYEHINVFGYNYYGGYNNGYHLYINRVRDAAVRDKQIAFEYKTNAARVKTGYDISGQLIDKQDKYGIAGVTITIKGTSIRTSTNSKGYFKIKVPENAILEFNYIGYQKKEIATRKETKLTVELKLDAHSLNEVVVMGYSSQKKNDVVGAVASVQIRGISNANTVANGLQGKALGVIISDGSAGGSDKVVMREISTEIAKKIVPITIRSNFNETAFFFPQLQTDEKGEILLNFTMPEALTRWKFRGLAYTKDLKTGYSEAMVLTQKQLSITANSPRFLREGDTITISARIANLTDKLIKGKAQMLLFNALNMQPVALLIHKTDTTKQFEIAANATKVVSFKMFIPKGIDALTYRLTADGGEFTDGEENTIPVLPNRMLVTESMPMMVRAGQTRKFVFDKLVSQKSETLQNKALTLEYTQNPVWYAVQALPYLMEFPYECSEQVFSRYYANSLASSIVSKFPVIKHVFAQWQNSNSAQLLSNLEKNPELKATLTEETPWLNDAANEAEQKRRVALLFDLNKMDNELKLNLDKLQKRQLPDGGFTWFGGNVTDRYMTQHILEGIGQLHHAALTDKDPSLQQLTSKALNYLDMQLIADDLAIKKTPYASPSFGDLAVEAWFTRSYFLEKPMSPQLEVAKKSFIKWAAEHWLTRNVYEQGMIALTMYRYNQHIVTKRIENSLLKTAQQSDELGMYWTNNRQGCFWYESPIETQSLLIELFTEAGNNQKAVEEMKIWLLGNKQTNNWKTTKATAAACYALLLKGNNLLENSTETSIKLNSVALTVMKPDLKADAGTGYIKTTWADEQIKPELGNVELINNGKTMSWGAMHWQYLENLDKITGSRTSIHLTRKYFIQKQTPSGPMLAAVDAAHTPKVGDLLKVVIYLKADRDFEYVQLKDMRPSCTEPVEALSAYKYQDGLWYYQVTKDVATNFFISNLNKGNYVFEYQLRVEQPGNFSTGITTIQSVYAPEFNAHSPGERITVSSK